MIRRIWTVYLMELSKALRLKLTYVGPALVVLAVCAALLVRPVVRDGASDYGFIAYSTRMAQDLLGLLLLLMYCAGLVSSELSSGSIRMVLVRPVKRWEFLGAKLMLGMSYAVVLTVLAGGSSWLLAFALGDVAGVSYGGEMIYTAQSMRNAYMVGALLSLAPQFAAVGYAVMLSTWTRNTGAAIATAIGLWVILDTVKYSLGVAPYLFLTYLETPWEVFSAHSEVMDATWFPVAKYCLITSSASLVLFVFVAGRILTLRDLNA